jgi:hypothetical protein
VNKVETLPWDEWGRMAASYQGKTGPDYDVLIDTIAAVCITDDMAPSPISTPLRTSLCRLSSYGERASAGCCWCEPTAGARMLVDADTGPKQRSAPRLHSVASIA